MNVSAKSEISRITNLHLSALNSGHNVTLGYSSDFIQYKYYPKTGEFNTLEVLNRVKTGYLIDNKYLVCASLHYPVQFNTVYIICVNLVTLSSCLINYSNWQNYKAILKEMQESGLQPAELKKVFYNGSGTIEYHENSLNII